MDVNQQLTQILYVLLKIKGFNNTIFRMLNEKNFNFLAFAENDRSLLKKNKVPDLVQEQFRLFDLSKTADHLADIEVKGTTVINYFDDRYPAQLKNLYDPPVLLFTKGLPLNLKPPALAMVGTRKCSPYGSAAAYDFASGLAQQGITVVSGMAEGIDTCAHRAALDSSGMTIAVLGGGFNHIYPKKNTMLFEEIVANGTVVSEYEPDMEPKPYFFPMRNRIVTGLSDAVMVVEGDVKSGAMISAYLALEQGKDVFALPGDVTSNLSRGPHRLIKEGAKLVENIADILEEPIFAPQQTLFGVPEKKLVNVDPEELTLVQDKILNQLSEDRISIDDLLDALDVSSAEIISSLLELELLGLIRQHPGKLFSRA